MKYAAGLFVAAAISLSAFFGAFGLAGGDGRVMKAYESFAAD